MNATRFRRRLAPMLYGLALIGAVTRCGEPTVTENPGGGGGGGGGPMAVRLNITGQPTNVAVGQVISPPVRVVVADSDFLAITSSSAPVTVSAIGTSNAPLEGTLTRNAESGTALMSGLTIGSVGTYRIIATSPGLISDTSDQFLVVGAGADTVTVDVGSATAADQRIFRSRRNLTINPAVDTIVAGGTIRWVWQGNLMHGIFLNAPPIVYISGNFTAPNEADFSISTPGTYAYVCSVHGAPMSGVLVVR